MDEINGPVTATTETGYGRRRDGTAWVACATDMPGVSAAMWDWWFGWHSQHSSRYKLWHPEAHAFSRSAGGDQDAPAGPRSAYIGRTSYVDEYIGPWLEQLAITFKEPSGAGFHVSEDTTVIYARVGSSVLPLDLGWLCHQVRPVPGGSQMRSRFYLNVTAFRRPRLRETARAIARGPLAGLRTPLPLNVRFARELLLHCGEEMNHLAAALPELHAEFNGTS